MIRLHFRATENRLEKSRSGGGRKPTGGGCCRSTQGGDDEGLQPGLWGWRKVGKLKRGRSDMIYQR